MFGSNGVLSKNLLSSRSFGTFTLPQRRGTYSDSFEIGSTPSTLMSSTLISISFMSSSGSRSTTLPFSHTAGFSFFWCFLGGSRTGYTAFYLSFFVLGPSLVDIGLGLGDLGDFGISAGISTLTISGVAPSDAIDPLALAVSTGADMSLVRSSWLL